MVTRFEFETMSALFLSKKDWLMQCREQLKEVNGNRILQAWAMGQIAKAGNQLVKSRQEYMALCERIKKEGIEKR